MSTSQGTFVWYDLMTTDTKAAESFYRSVVGWSAADSGMGDRSYTILSAGSTGVGGLMPIPDASTNDGGEPMWSGYIAVDDVDAHAKRVKAAGGAIHHNSEDIPGVGRFAIAADPHGATFMLFRGSRDEAPAAPAPGTPGTLGWHELHAGDGAKDFAFYADLFRWTKTEAMDMGATGVYQIFATGGKETVGAVMTKTPETLVPHWLYYFNVDAIDAAAARVRDGGGKTVTGPMEVPGGQWIVQCLDPQGARFALVAPGR